MQFTSLPTASLHGGDNPRQSMDSPALDELERSIKQDGILEPLRVVKNESGYRVESGHRRLAVANALGLAEVPVLIVDGDQSVEEFTRALVTNVQRDDLNPVDEAMAYNALITNHGLTAAGVAERIGVAKVRVTSRLELLTLPADVVELYEKGKLPLSARKSFAAIAKVEESIAVAVAKLAAKNVEWGELVAKSPGRVVDHLAVEKGWARIPGRIERDGLLSPELEKRAIKLDTEYMHWKPFITVEQANEAVQGSFAYRGKGSDNAVVMDRSWLAVRVQQALETREKVIAAEKLEYEKFSEIDAKAVPANETEAAAAKEFRKQERAALLAGRDIAKGRNLELGRVLLDKLSVAPYTIGVDLEHVVAASLVGQNPTELFLRGLRYCLPKFITEKDLGTKDKPKPTTIYVSTHEEAGPLVTAFLHPENARPGERLGRALILLAAARYADQGVLPQSGRKSDCMPRMKASDGGNKPPYVDFIGPFDALLKDVAPADLWRAGQTHPNARKWPSDAPVEKLRKEFAKEQAK